MSDPIFSESDIWLAARSMIQRYGSDAAREATERAEDALEDGDPEGSAIWQRILAAIKRLQAEHPAPGEKVQ